MTCEKKQSLASLSTDEVLERIQQQMAEVMASAQEAASSAVTNESEARAVFAGSDNIPTTGKGELHYYVMYIPFTLLKHK